jgi:two-component system cell cycle response regulator DivK
MRKVLVVDDNDVNRILATRLLGKSGWDVSEADCGEAALSFLVDKSLDLILLDVSMPGMSGQEVCQKIRSAKLGGEAVKVVAYTAHAMPEEVAGLLAGGFDTVLSKPMSRDRLTATLSELGLL